MNSHPESTEEIPADLPFRKAIVTMEDIDGNLHTNWWMVAEYRGCYVLTHEEIDSAIVAEPGAKIAVTYLEKDEPQ